MRGYRHLTSLAAMAIAVLFAPGLASAETPYPPPPPSLSVSSGTVTVGDSVDIFGSGFGGNENVVINVSYGQGTALGAGAEGAAWFVPAATKTVATNADGAFQTAVTLTRVGVATIMVTGQESGLSASATVTVRAAAAPGLPTTGERGQALRTAMIIGGAALLAGVVLVSITVRRRRKRGASRRQATAGASDGQ